MYDVLIDRIHKEQEEYLAEIKTKSADEIVRNAYEICWREEFMILLESTYLDDDTIKTLLGLTSILDTLYDEWLKTDVGVQDMLTEVVEYFVRKEN